MKNDSALEQALYAMEQFKHQVENLSRQRQVVMMSMEEHMRARLTLSEYGKSSDGHELLVPVGANTFLFARAARPDKVLIGIGGDVVIEDTAAGASEKLDSTIKLLEEADRRIAGRIIELENQIMVLNAEVERGMAASGGKR
jgi:prefoldin alpha subunit